MPHWSINKIKFESWGGVVNWGNVKIPSEGLQYKDNLLYTIFLNYLWQFGKEEIQEINLEDS